MYCNSSRMCQRMKETTTCICVCMRIFCIYSMQFHVCTSMYGQMRYICIRMYINLYECARECLYVCKYLCVDACVYGVCLRNVYIYINLYKNICIYKNVPIYIYIYIYIYVNMNTYIYVYMSIYTYTYI